MSDKKVKKSTFAAVVTTIKVVLCITVIGVSVYSGMYIMSSSYYNEHDAHGAMISAIDNAMRSTVDQPIVIITPENSIWEKTKYKFGVEEPKRPVVHISTSTATEALVVFLQTAETNNSLPWYKAAYYGTGNGLSAAWTGTKNGASYAWHGTKTASIATYDFLKFWGEEDEAAIIE